MFFPFSFFDIAAKRIMKFWTHLDFVYRWTNLYKEEKQHLENLFNLTNEVTEFFFFVFHNKLDWSVFYSINFMFPPDL